MKYEDNILDYLEADRKVTPIEVQMQVDYLFGNVNRRIPEKELHPDLRQPKGLVLGIIEAIKRGTARRAEAQ